MDEYNYQNEGYRGAERGNGEGDMPKLGWSWGAFSFGWIWGIGNHAYLTLIALIPIPLLGLVWLFVNGALGKKWAWESGKFATAAEFNAAQKTWDRAGIAAFVLWAAVLALIILLVIAAAALFAAAGTAGDIDINTYFSL